MSGSVAFGVVCHAAYILGFPADTPQTIAEDVEALKQICFDHVSFFIRPFRDRRIISGSTWLESRWTEI
jgi:hypothetical protein